MTKKKIIESLQINPKDVGSSEVQIGLLSEKINNLSSHFKRIEGGQRSHIDLPRPLRTGGKQYQLF